MICYSVASQVGAANIGPPASIGMTINYVIHDPLTGTLSLCESSGDYNGRAACFTDLPVTQAQVQAAAEAQVQAAEPASPGLVFVWVMTP